MSEQLAGVAINVAAKASESAGILAAFGEHAKNQSEAAGELVKIIMNLLGDLNTFDGHIAKAKDTEVAGAMACDKSARGTLYAVGVTAEGKGAAIFAAADEALAGTKKVDARLDTHQQDAAILRSALGELAMHCGELATTQFGLSKFACQNAVIVGEAAIAGEQYAAQITSRQGPPPQGAS